MFVKVMSKIGFVISAIIVLMLSLLLCTLIWGWITPDQVMSVIVMALSNGVVAKILLGVAIVLVMLTTFSIANGSDDKSVNGVKEGVIISKDSGDLVISKSTLEDMVFNTVSKYANVQNPQIGVIVKKNGKVLVYITMDVANDTVIKDLSNRIQNDISSTIKNCTELEVENVNVSVRGIGEDVLPKLDYRIIDKPNVEEKKREALQEGKKEVIEDNKNSKKSNEIKKETKTVNKTNNKTNTKITNVKKNDDKKPKTESKKTK